VGGQLHRKDGLTTHHPPRTTDHAPLTTNESIDNLTASFTL